MENQKIPVIHRGLMCENGIWVVRRETQTELCGTEQQHLKCLYSSRLLSAQQSPAHELASNPRYLLSLSPASNRPFFATGYYLAQLLQFWLRKWAKLPWFNFIQPPKSPDCPSMSYLHYLTLTGILWASVSLERHSTPGGWPNLPTAGPIAFTCNKDTEYLHIGKKKKKQAVNIEHRHVKMKGCH